MESIIYNPNAEQEYCKEINPKAWEVKVTTHHINSDFISSWVLQFIMI
jgi:hypothetical protein